MNIANAEAIQGWMFRSELEWLAEQAAKSKTIVEFGCHRGRSTRALADNTSGTIYAVDPWVSENVIIIDGKLYPTDVYDIFAENLADHIERGRVIPCKYLSDEFSRVWDAADLVFIDGNHAYEQVKRDIKRARKIAKRGGIIAGHDYSHEANCPGVKQAVDELYPSINRADSIWWVVNE
jgi:predicted O-methyltransferase YrrM